MPEKSDKINNNENQQSLLPGLIKRLGISIIYWNHVAFNGTGFIAPTWNDGMLEYWNIG